MDTTTNPITLKVNHADLRVRSIYRADGSITMEVYGPDGFALRSIEIQAPTA